VPANGLIFSCLCLLMGSAVLIVMPSIMAAFTVMTTISSVLFIFVWSMVLISYFKYRKTRPERHAASVYKTPGGRGVVGATQAVFIFVLILLCFEKDTRQVLMITPIWFIILAVGYRWLRKRRL
jgi:D-serine/D-alanine/glycine transporter